MGCDGWDEMGWDGWDAMDGMGCMACNGWGVCIAMHADLQWIGQWSSIATKKGTVLVSI